MLYWIKSPMINEEFIRSVFNIPLKCFGHCDKEASLRFVNSKTLTACVTCPDGYVSRVIMYDAEIADIKNFLHSVGVDAKDQELRVATRHPWDLATDVTLREVYWTQNYRRSSDGNPQSLFICSKCSNFFMQPLHSGSRVCGNCSN